MNPNPQNPEQLQSNLKSTVSCLSHIPTLKINTIIGDLTRNKTQNFALQGEKNEKRHILVT